MIEDNKDLRLLWGKARLSTGTTQTWHPLLWHSLDVLAVGEVLLGSRQDALARHAVALGWETKALRRFVLFGLGVHDIGKVSRAFQGKCPEHWPEGLLGAMGRPETLPQGPRHDAIGMEVLAHKLRPALVPLLPDWDPEERTALLAPFAGHHGKPVAGDGVGQRVFDAPCEQAARAFLGLVRDLVEPEPLPPPEGGLAMLSWWLAGLAVAADWLGSNQGWFVLPACAGMNRLFQTAPAS